MKLNSVASRREFLKELSTSELDRMLQAELRKETIDDDLVRLVLSVLEEREKNYPVELNEEIAAAAEDFEGTMKMPRGVPTRKKLSPVLKAASILLVVGLLLFVVPQAAHAESFFDLLARWTESVFEFFNPTEERDEQPEYVFKTDNPGLQQIYDAVVEMGVTDPVVPMWVPDGYELFGYKVIDLNQEKSIQSVLKKDENAIVFRLLILHDNINVNVYKDEVGTTIYEYNGVTHYVLNNVERQIATWNADGVVCSVSVDCQEDILIDIIKSIYTSEGN